jgi:light-harvesting complex 1 beta chain
MGAVTALGPSLKECQIMADKNESLTGLTEAEAMEVQKYMVQGYLMFVGIAVVAHLLVWSWRPWFAPITGWK